MERFSEGLGPPALEGYQWCAPCFKLCIYIQKDINWLETLISDGSILLASCLLFADTSDISRPLHFCFTSLHWCVESNGHVKWKLANDNIKVTHFTFNTVLKEPRGSDVKSVDLKPLFCVIMFPLMSNRLCIQTGSSLGWLYSSSSGEEEELKVKTPLLKFLVKCNGYWQRGLIKMTAHIHIQFVCVLSLTRSASQA